MNTNLWRDFQLCISIPFSTLVMDLTVKPGGWIVITLILDFWFSSLKQFAYSYGILVTASSPLPSVNKGQLKSESLKKLIVISVKVAYETSSLIR